MRIAFCIRGLNNGGADRVAAALSIIWGEMGHQVILLTATQQVAEEYPHACFARCQMDFNRLCAEDVHKLCDEYKIDIVVFNDAINGEWFDRVFRLFGENKNIKRVVISHHPSTNWFYTLGNTGDVLKVGILSSADALVSVDAIHALWWHYCGCRSVFIQNPAAVGFERCTDYHPSHNIVWVGRTRDYCKRFLNALSCFVELAEKDTQATLTVLGPIDKNLSRQVHKLLPKGCKSRVRFEGFVPNPAKILETAGLYLFTSNSEATIPQVVLEAQAMGLPIVAYDIPDIGELTENDGVVKVDEHNGNMARKMSELLNDPARLTQLSEAARLSAKRRQQSGGCIRGWENLFSALSTNDSQRRIAEMASNFKDERTHRRLTCEILHAERHFVECHMPELLKWRKITMRLNVSYLMSRALARFKNRLSR